ncbi:MAG: carboxylate--amine ligase [Beutenbergiaceae bacterium]
MTDLRPIIIGGDIGAYACARTFHEAYGARSVVLAGVSTGAVAHSSIIDHRIVAGLDDDDELAAAIGAVAAERPDCTHLVLGSADHAVQALVRIREQLPAVIVPYAEAAAMEQVTSKAGFSQLCLELGIPHPRTQVLRIDAGQWQLPAGVAFPLVLKAASSAQFHAVEFPGKRKVAFLATMDELTQLLQRMATAGFSGDVVLQELIPGSDEDMAAVNSFCDTSGMVRFQLFGQVLLEEATPNGLGNSVAQITGGASAHDEAVEHARRLLAHIGWTGFANIDLKRDPRDGRYRFLELNPRVGRSGYAVTCAGYNTALMYGHFYAGQPSPPWQGEHEESALYVGENEHLFTVVPLALLHRYVSAGMWRRVRGLRRRAATNPYYYAAERNPRRWLYIAMAMFNQFRKFRRWHEPSGRG